jgi:putative DNA primase/helicase
MDEMLARVNRIYPNSKFVKIQAYSHDAWKDREYDSSFDNKAALNKWKSSPLEYDDAVHWAEQGGRVGWIVPEGFVVVDIDNNDHEFSQERIQYILDKFEVAYSYNYTSKGMHILLQDPGRLIKSDSRCKCSINIDIDTRANGTGYIILPTNDPHREWGEWNDFVEDIPYFLSPVGKDPTPSFIGMKEGDGRNTALFKWRTRLESANKLTDEQIEKSIRIINEYLFDVPMTNPELYKTVLREKDKKKDRGGDVNKENPYNKIADDICGKYDIVSYYSNFYRFNGTYYKPMTEIELERIIHLEVNHNIGHAGRKEIIEFLKLKTQVSIEDFDKDWYKIACMNGVLNLVTGEVETPSKSDINTIFIPYNYNDDPVYSPRIDQFMKELTGGDPLKMEFLYQVAGYCLLKKNLFEKFVICKGEGGTGKSTYTNLLQKMVGGDVNCSHVGLADFDKDYYLASTQGKLLNVDDDAVDGKVLETSGRFKSVISGNVISVRQIYREVMDYIPFITCIFSCNKLPRIMDKTTGLYRRMILISLNHKVKSPDPLFMNKVTDTDMEYFLYKAVQGVKTAIEEGGFRITQSEQQLLDLFKRRQSPLNQWLYETDTSLGNVHGAKCSVLYGQFRAWCEENGYKNMMSSFTFKEDICAIYDVEIAPGLAQTFVKLGDFDPDSRPF